MDSKRVNSAEIKLQNRKRIYNYIRNHISVSKQDIAYGLQLSLPTVTQNLKYLCEQKLIDTSMKITNTGGRNAIAYTYIKSAKVAIGIDITKHHIKSVMVDLSGNVIRVIKKRELFEMHDLYYRKLGLIVEETIEETGIEKEKLLGVGVAVPGLLSDDGERVIYGLTMNFTGETRENLAKYIPYPNCLYHDAYAAGYSEVWASSQIDNAFYITLGNSIGGAVHIANNLYLGDSHKSGEIGHMKIYPTGGEQCYCGQKGCFDVYCSALRLSDQTDGDLAEFFRRVSNGDSEMNKIWDEYLQHLSIAISNIRMLFDCKIIVGGYVGVYIEGYMHELCQRVDEISPFRDRAKDFLVPCQYKVEAIAAGAAIMYIDQFIKNI